MYFCLINLVVKKIRFSKNANDWIKICFGQVTALPTVASEESAFWVGLVCLKSFGGRCGSDGVKTSRQIHFAWHNNNWKQSVTIFEPTCSKFMPQEKIAFSLCFKPENTHCWGKYALSPILLVWIQLLHNIQISYFLFCSNPVLFN